MIPDVDDEIGLYNEEEYCPQEKLSSDEFNTVLELKEKDDLMKQSTDQICGYLGTRNLVETSFILQYVVSFHNLLNDNGLKNQEIPVTVGFLFTVVLTAPAEV